MSSSPAFKLPTVADVVAARARIKDHAVVTPLVESPLLNERLGGRLFAKAEVLQRTGSFKFRGAYNRLAELSPDERRRGVITYSSGNYAQGIAAAAKLLGIPAVILMPADAPRIKLDNTRAHGAEVLPYDRHTESREAMGERIGRERGLVLVKPYDEIAVVAGQGTAGLELIEQAKARGAKLDAVLAPCGGGGLVAGCAIAVAAESPGTEMFAVEPEGFDDTRRSLEKGSPVPNVPGAQSFCDALLMGIPGDLTFAVNSKLVTRGIAVSDDAVRTAMVVAFNEFKLVVEPSGSVALAAILSGAVPIRNRTVAVVLSGGNVDPGTFRDALARAG